MNQQDSRQEILDRIARVTENRAGSMDEINYAQEEIYKPVGADALTCFKQELEAISGQCIICQDESDLFHRLAVLMQEKGLPNLFTRDTSIAEKLRLHQIAVETDESRFDDMQAGVTTCEYLVARTGSAVVVSSGGSGRQMHAYPPIHIILASAGQLVNYLQDALEGIQKSYKHRMPSAVSVITGPSRTADIEKTLVLGAHGPKELIIFVEQNL